MGPRFIKLLVLLVVAWGLLGAVVGDTLVVRLMGVALFVFGVLPVLVLVVWSWVGSRHNQKKEED